MRKQDVQYDVEKMAQYGRFLKGLYSSMASLCPYYEGMSMDSYKTAIEKKALATNFMYASDDIYNNHKPLKVETKIRRYMRKARLITDRTERYISVWKLENIAARLFVAPEHRSRKCVWLDIGTICDDVRGFAPCDYGDIIIIVVLSIIARAGAAIADVEGMSLSVASRVCGLFDIPGTEAENMYELIKLYRGYRHVYRASMFYGRIDEVLSVPLSDTESNNIWGKLSFQAFKDRTYRPFDFAYEERSVSGRLVPPGRFRNHDNKKTLLNIISELCEMVNSANIVWQMYEIIYTPLNSSKELKAIENIEKMLETLSSCERYCYNILMHAGARHSVVRCYFVSLKADIDITIFEVELRRDIYHTMYECIMEKGIDFSFYDCFAKCQYGDAAPDGMPSFSSINKIVNWHLTLPYAKTIEEDLNGNITYVYPQFGIRLSGSINDRDRLDEEATSLLKHYFVESMVRSFSIQLPIDDVF